MQPHDENTSRHSPALNNTYIMDAENAGELARLMQQDRVITEGMGGLFPEGQSLPDGGRVLDLACGPGGWTLEVAFTYPKVEVIGVDLSANVIEYARAQAWSRGLENIQFHVMNIMEPLDFPDASFDLINGRLLFGFMLPAAWPRLLAQCRRLLKPGGVVRLTETEWPLTNSPAFETQMNLLSRALKEAGQSFSVDGRHVGILPVLPWLVRQAGFVDVRTRASVIEWSLGTPAHYSVFKDCMLALELVRPFLLKMGAGSREELERLYQQSVTEMQQEGFCGVWTLLTAWGRQPEQTS